MIFPEMSDLLIYVTGFLPLLGFLGIGGGERKRMQKRQASEARGLRMGLESYRTTPRPDVDLARREYRGLIEDPTKRGFSEGTVGKMFGRQADVATGQRSSFSNMLRRNLAGRGMGNTGAGLRAQMQFRESQDTGLRSAMRDIDLENENLKRQEYFGALSALPQIQSMEDEFNLRNFGTQLGTFRPEQEAMQQAYKPGFWGNLGPALLQAGATAFGGPIGGWAASKLLKPKSSGPYNL